MTKRKNTWCSGWPIKYPKKKQDALNSNKEFYGQREDAKGSYKTHKKVFRSNNDGKTYKYGSFQNVKPSEDLF